MTGSWRLAGPFHDGFDLCCVNRRKLWPFVAFRNCIQAGSCKFLCLKRQLKWCAAAVNVIMQYIYCIYHSEYIYTFNICTMDQTRNSIWRDMTESSFSYQTEPVFPCRCPYLPSILAMLMPSEVYSGQVITTRQSKNSRKESQTSPSLNIIATSGFQTLFTTDWCTFIWLTIQTHNNIYVLLPRVKDAFCSRMV